MAVNFSGINYYFFGMLVIWLLLKDKFYLLIHHDLSFFCLLLDVDGPGPSYMEASTLIVSPELLPSHTCKSEQSK